MITYPLANSDLLVIKELHEKFYSELPLPDFTRNCLSPFKILDDDFKIITVGAVKLTSELVLLTDKEKSQRDRAHALISALQIGSLASNSFGNDLLNATVVNDDKWLEQLISYGFRKSVGTHLVIG